MHTPIYIFFNLIIWTWNSPLFRALATSSWQLIRITQPDHYWLGNQNFKLSHVAWLTQDWRQGSLAWSYCQWTELELIRHCMLWRKPQIYTMITTRFKLVLSGSQNWVCDKTIGPTGKLAGIGTLALPISAKYTGWQWGRWLWSSSSRMGWPHKTQSICAWSRSRFVF